MPKLSKTYHKRLSGDTERVITETFDYDSQNRLLVHKHKVDNNPEEILAQNTYNDLSQLTNKKVGGTVASSPLQSIDYLYNIRGWMTKINDPSNLNGRLFGYEIKYNNPVYTSLSAGKYNGNIAEIDWAGSQDSVLKRYSYQYDPLNRLKKGIYSEPNSSIPQNNYFNEELSYDLNGNIISLQRNRNATNVGVQLMDNLSYTYTGNRLNTVTDSSGNYFGYPDTSGILIHYDVNGNMTDHEDKGLLELRYNHLNLPNYIKFNEYVMREDPFGFGLETKYKNTTYLYRADGVKLKKVHNYFSGRMQTDVATTTEYLDGFQYSSEGRPFSVSSAILQFVSTSEGYYDFTKNKYIYQYKDQVGNIRLAFFKDEAGNAVVDRTTDYYPFGLEFGGDLNIYGSISPTYTYTFQEQEKQLDTGWNSFKWRNYDPAMGRFFNVDPLSDKYSYQSHYNFSENAVVNSRELEGLEAVLINDNTIEWKVKIDNKLGFESSKTLSQDAADILSQNGLTVKIINDPKASFTVELALATTREDPITRDPITRNGYTENDGNIYDGKVVSKNNPRTLAHELGHKASLPHIFDETSKVTNTKENQKNLMNSGANTTETLQDSRGTDLVPSQTTDIKSHIKIYNENRERKEKSQIPNTNTNAN